jgi:very-short-patch-repair endonuclease
MTFTYNGQHYDSIAAFKKSPAARKVVKSTPPTPAQLELARLEEKDLERALATQIKQHGLPEPKEQFMLPESARKYRWDFAWPQYRLVVEVNGGIWVPSEHSTGTGIKRDYDKNNEGELCGYSQLTFDSGAIDDGSAVLLIQKFMHGYAERVMAEHKHMTRSEVMQ